MARITINGISLDADTQQAQLSALGLSAKGGAASDYILIQTHAPLTRDQRVTLEGLGALVLEYVPSSTYIARFHGDGLQPIGKLPFVRWVNEYLQGFKVAVQLRSQRGGPHTAELLSLGPVETSMAQEPRRVDIVLHSGVAARDELAKKVAQAAHLDASSVHASGRKIRAVVRPQDLDAIARIDQVRHIEEVAEPKLLNSVAVGILRAHDVHNHANLRGAGQVIAVCDTGFDTGSTTHVHSAFVGRVRKLYALGRTTPNDPDGHGTHVAGSALGDGVSTQYGAVPGTAPAAELVLQSVLDSMGGLRGLPVNLNSLFGPPYATDEARVHTNSWGSQGAAAYGQYTTYSYEVDEFVWNNRDLVVCFAAGNEGADGNKNGVVDLGSVTPPGTAKNCITVGASESDRPAGAKRYGAPWPTDFPTNPLADDLWADDPDGMAAFSSRGPTRDGRIKPDVVAPGTAILSAHPRTAKVGAFWGTSSDPEYCFMGGTSMATPLVAGCAAVTREHLIRGGLPRPSAALVKAILINGARDIRGQYTPSEADSVPNHSEGFGRVDLSSSVGPYQAGESVRYWDENLELETGDEEHHDIHVTQHGTALKITLVWTDPPGDSLQNDLDLVALASTGEERRGNTQPGVAAFDRVNNVEQILWEDVPIGVVRVTVRAHRTTVFAQPYALVARTRS